MPSAITWTTCSAQTTQRILPVQLSCRMSTSQMLHPRRRCKTALLACSPLQYVRHSRTYCPAYSITGAAHHLTALIIIFMQLEFMLALPQACNTQVASLFFTGVTHAMVFAQVFTCGHCACTALEISWWHLHTGLPLNIVRLPGFGHPGNLVLLSAVCRVSEGKLPGCVLTTHCSELLVCVLVVLQDVPADCVRSQCDSTVPATSSAPVLDGLYRPSGSGFSSPSTGLHLHSGAQQYTQQPASG